LIRKRARENRHRRVAAQRQRQNVLPGLPKIEQRVEVIENLVNDLDRLLDRPESTESSASQISLHSLF